MNSFACGLPAHHRNVDSLIAYIERLEQQVEDLTAQLTAKENTVSDRRERFTAPAEEECVTVVGTQRRDDDVIIIFYSDDTYRFAPVVKPR